MLCASDVLSLLLSLAPLISAARVMRVIRVDSCFTDRAYGVPPAAPAVRLLRPAVPVLRAAAGVCQVPSATHVPRVRVSPREAAPPGIPLAPEVDEGGGIDFPLKKEEDEAEPSGGAPEQEAKLEEKPEVVQEAEPEATPEDKQQPADPREPPPARGEPLFTQ